MTLEDWWPKLTPETRDWLLANAGDEVPPAIVAELSALGVPEQWWSGETGPSGFFVSDEAVDWLEELANGEG